MDIQQMIDFHRRMKAEVTVAAIPVPSHQAIEFGVIECDAQGAIHGFHEKSEDAPAIPGEADKVYASMGNYIFSARALYRELKADAAQTGSRNDFGLMATLALQFVPSAKRAQNANQHCDG